MKKRAALLATIALVSASAAFAQSGALADAEPPYPRIANLYGAGLSWLSVEQGMPYWKKLGMIVGGGSDWHYDYESARTIATHEKALSAARALRLENPRVRILPYYDVIEGPDDPSLPRSYWLRGLWGKRVSTWPGFYRVNTKNKAVLDRTQDAILARAFAEDVWDGAFLDCWEPDGYLVPALRSSSQGRYIVTNIGTLPRIVSSLANGAMSEDELNLVAAGKMDFENLMDRYLRWCRDSAKPALTIVSCYPRTIDPDPWRWAKKTDAERGKILAEGRTADPAMMRFGLGFTLMGDGYFAYDGGTQARGSDWWYPEYEAPLGLPSGSAREIAPLVWAREFSGASVRVNGSRYDEELAFDRVMKDASTGRVARSFVLPRTDGRIYLVTAEPENEVPADELRFPRPARR